MLFDEFGKTIGVRMKWLITGGSGFLGINLVRYIRDRGIALRSLDVLPFSFPEASSIEPIEGDIRDRDAVRQAMAGVDTVIHCAAALPLYAPEEIRSVDVDGTRVLLKCALESGIERVVHISSTAVYGVPDHHPLIEDDPLSGVGPYGEAKVAAERACLDFREQGLCVPILRPKSFVGPERLGIFELLFDFAYRGKNFPVIGSGANRYQLLDVEDLCEAIFLCATQEKSKVNDVFNVGAAHFGTIREDFQAVLDHANYGKKIIGLPERPAIFALRILEAMNLSPVYKWIYETASRDSFVSIAKIRGRLGFSPRYSNRDALIRNYDWYVQNREQIASANGPTHRAPWKRGALRLAEAFF